MTLELEPASRATRSRNAASRRHSHNECTSDIDSVRPHQPHYRSRSNICLSDYIFVLRQTFDTNLGGPKQLLLCLTLKRCYRSFSIVNKSTGIDLQQQVFDQLKSKMLHRLANHCYCRTIPEKILFFIYIGPKIF